MNTCIRSNSISDEQNGQLNNRRAESIFINYSESLIQANLVINHENPKFVKNNQQLQVYNYMNTKCAINNQPKIPISYVKTSPSYSRKYECEKNNSENDSLAVPICKQDNYTKNSGTCSSSFSTCKGNSPQSSQSTQSSQNPQSTQNPQNSQCLQSTQSSQSFQSSQNSQNSQNSQFPQIINPEVKKFKTELCHTYELLGTCKYGANCSFAHGKNDLRETGKSQKKKEYLKNRQCRQFFLEGYCPYGERCQFNHQILARFEKLILFEFGTNDKKPNKLLIKRPRLKVFQQIVPDENLQKTKEDKE